MVSASAIRNEDEKVNVMNITLLYQNCVIKTIQYGNSKEIERSEEIKKYIRVKINLNIYLI